MLIILNYTASLLILFAIFFGLSQFSNYLKLYYELLGAAEKIGIALAIPQEKVDDDSDQDDFNQRWQDAEHHVVHQRADTAGTPVYIT